MNLSELINEILSEWAYRCNDGMPNPKNPIHLKELSNVLSEMGLSHIKNTLVENLLMEKGKTPEKHVVEADKAFSNPILSKKVSYKDKDGNAKDGIVGNLLRLPKDSPGRVAAEKLLPPEGSPERDAMNKDLGGEGQPKKPEDEKGKEGGEEAPKEDPAKAAAAMFDPKADPAMGARMDREKDANAQLAKDAEADKQAEKEQEPKKEDEFAPIDSKDVAKEMPQADPETFNGDSDIPDGIEPNDLEQFNTDISKVQQMVADAKAKGEKAPNINLCDVTVPGTNLYCDDNLGIPREEMPQFKGKPQPGTPAAEMAVDENGEVDTEPLFKKMLEEKGIKVVQTEVPSDKLKATQSELVGAKVVGMMGALEENPEHPSITAPIYVSRDGFVIDGHHRWAAIAAYNAKNPDKQIPMKVQVIDQDIKDAIPMCNKFAEEQGVAAKKADANKEGPSEPTKREPANNDPESKAQQFKGKSSGENIQTMEMEGGGLMYGTKHDNTKMVDDILDDVKSKIPKERWKDVVFVGEGGFKNNDGEFEFKGEMDHSASKFKEMGSSVDTWDGDDTDVTNNESPLYKRQEEETGLSNEEVMAANWASMVGQGDSVEDMIPEDYLTDKGKELLKKSAEEANLPLSDTWDSNPTEEDVDSLYRLSFADDNGDKKTKVHDAQVSFNKFRDENLLRKNKELAAQGKIPITIAGESHVDLVDKMSRNDKKPSQNLPKPEKPSEEDGGVVYSVGGGYYSDKPNGPAQYMASESVVEKVLIEGNINFSHLLFEAAVTKKTSKGKTVKLVTIDPKNQEKATADAAASKGGGWEEPDWMKNAKPGWDAEKVKNKSAWGDEPMQEPDWIKNAKPGWNTKPSPGDAPRNAAPPVGKKVGAVPPPPPPPPPGTKKAGAVPPPPPPPPPSAPTSAPKLTDKIRQKISKWTEKEKAFFDRNEGAPGSKERRSLGQALRDKAAGAWKAIKKGAKHEVEEFKAAGKGVQNFFSGKPLSEHEQKALKSVAFKVVTTAVFGAAFGGLSHGVAAFGKHVAMEFIPHIIGETLLKGVGKAAVFADADGEAETDANMIKFAEMISKGLEEMEITPEMMEQMVDSYNEKKEGKSTNEMKIESLIKEIISEIKLEAKEGESKKYPGYYHMGGGYYSKKAGGEITHKTVDGGMKALSAKEKAEKNKNQKPASKPPQTVATDKDLQARVGREKAALDKEKDKKSTTPSGKLPKKMEEDDVFFSKDAVERKATEADTKVDSLPIGDKEKAIIKGVIRKVLKGEGLTANEIKVASDWITFPATSDVKIYFASEAGNFKDHDKVVISSSMSEEAREQFNEFLENNEVFDAGHPVKKKSMVASKLTPKRTFTKVENVKKDKEGNVTSVTVGNTTLERITLPTEKELIKEFKKQGIENPEQEAKDTIVAIERHNANVNFLASQKDIETIDFGHDTNSSEGRRDTIESIKKMMAKKLLDDFTKYYKGKANIPKEARNILSLINNLSNPYINPSGNAAEKLQQEIDAIAILMNNNPDFRAGVPDMQEIFDFVVKLGQGYAGFMPSASNWKVTDIVTYKPTQSFKFKKGESPAEAIAKNLQTFKSTVLIEGGSSVKYEKGGASAGLDKILMTVYNKHKGFDTQKELVKLFDTYQWSFTPGEESRVKSEKEIQAKEAELNDTLNRAVAAGIISSEEKEEILAEGEKQAAAMAAKVEKKVPFEKYKQCFGKSPEEQKKNYDNYKKQLGLWCKMGAMAEVINNNDARYQLFGNLRTKYPKKGAPKHEVIDGVNVLSGMGWSYDPGISATGKDCKYISMNNANSSHIEPIKRKG